LTARFDAIGVVRSPFVDKKDAPRQPRASTAEGTIELFSGRDLEDALSGIEEWSHIWVLYVFDRAGGYRPKVLPPRAHAKKGVLATRSPHRPNPIGLSVVRLLRVRGLSLDVAGVDMLDGSPVIDLKPYVAYTDSIQDASAGWLAVDPAPAYEVVFSPEAREDLECLLSHGVDLERAIVQSLSLGPAPHAYRRIKKDGATSVLAVKDWRVRFSSDEPARTIAVTQLFSGYSARELASARPDLEAHRVLERRRPARG
jgi:tRNA-Thr(GGU) m(6)t(6)A37 methyltransferase TsaA